MGVSEKIRGFGELWQFDNRFELIFSRLFRPGRSQIIYKYRGIEFLSDHSAGDANGARAVLATDMYRKLLAKMDLPEKVSVLDIGANNGGFPLLLASERYKIDRLLSIELNPKTFDRLNSNIARNFGPEAECVNAAVCGYARAIHFSEGSAGTSDNIYQAEGSGLQIEGITLNDAIERVGADKLDICKMDIEGAEFEIFASGNAGHLTRCNYLLIEIHHYPEPDKNREIVRRAIMELGFNEVDPPPNDDEHHVHLFQNIKNAGRSDQPA